MLKALDLSLGNLLKKVNIDFLPGRIHGIVGPNGAGKSTLLRALSGLWPLTSGEILWNGTPLLKRSRLEISRTISLVPQDLHVNFNFTAEQIVAMGCYGRKQVDSSIARALEAVGAKHLRNRCITMLSQGEKQLIFLARAIATESPILLLDEPMSSLDIQHQLQILNSIQQFKEEGKVVIVVLHDFPLAKRLCDTLTLLHQGKSIATGCYEEIINKESLQSVFQIPEDNHLSTLINPLF